MTFTVGIAGASGYAGGELVRLLGGHPHFDVVTLAASAKAGTRVGDVHPHLFGWADRQFQPTDATTLGGHDLVFLALPHGASAELAAQLPATTKVVDLGADFRLQSAADWAQYYGNSPHAGTWTYGLPELGDRREIAAAMRVANPGCYATVIALACAPAVAAGLIDASDIVVVAASGTSGAGRTASEALLASEVMGSMSSYKTGGVHQHTPEIEQTLRAIAGGSVKLSFTPLLAPMPRGIHATVTARVAPGVTAEALHAAFAAHYAGEKFVQVLQHDQQPRTGSVLGTNHAQLQVLLDRHTDRMVVTAVIDNLVKGAAGQAIQNANLMFGLNESAGLDLMGVAP